MKKIILVVLFLIFVSINAFAAIEINNVDTNTSSNGDVTVAYNNHYINMVNRQEINMLEKYTKELLDAKGVILKPQYKKIKLNKKNVSAYCERLKKLQSILITYNGPELQRQIDNFRNPNQFIASRI